MLYLLCQQRSCKRCLLTENRQTTECRYCFCLELLNEDIGFQYNKSFPDESLATSDVQFRKDFAHPSNGRLYKPWKFWCPSVHSESFYLELVLVQKYYIFAASIQGHFVSNDFKTEFTISYSLDYEKWQQYDTTFTVRY